MYIPHVVPIIGRTHNMWYYRTLLRGREGPIKIGRYPLPPVVALLFVWSTIYSLLLSYTMVYTYGHISAASDNDYEGYNTIIGLCLYPLIRLAN